MSWAFTGAEMVTYAAELADDQGYNSVAAYILDQWTRDMDESFRDPAVATLDGATFYAEEYRLHLNRELQNDPKPKAKLRLLRELALISVILPDEEA